MGGRGILVAAALAAACGGGKPAPHARKPPVAAAKPKPKQPTCPERAAEFGRWLGQVVAEGIADAGWVSGDVSLVVVGDPPGRFERGAILTVMPDPVTASGRPGGDPKNPRKLAAALVRELKRERADARKVGGQISPNLVVFVDQRTPWAVVAAAGQAATKAGYDRATFVFDASSQVEPPRAAKIDDELAELRKDADPAALARAIAEGGAGLPGRVFKDCVQALELLPKLAGLGEAERDQRLGDELPKAIEACDCRGDLASARALMWAWFARDAGAPMIGANLKLAGARDRHAPAVTAAPATSWADSYKTVLDAAVKGEPVRFDAK